MLPPSLLGVDCLSPSLLGGPGPPSPLPLPWPHFPKVPVNALPLCWAHVLINLYNFNFILVGGVFLSVFYTYNLQSIKCLIF
jgi:hypothetical protein